MKKEITTTFWVDGENIEEVVKAVEEIIPLHSQVAYILDETTGELFVEKGLDGTIIFHKPEVAYWLIEEERATGYAAGRCSNLGDIW